MASKISRKNTVSVQGILNIHDGRISFEVEDIESAVPLDALAADFVGEDCKLTLTMSEEL